MTQISQGGAKMSFMKKFLATCWKFLSAWTVVGVWCGLIALVLGFIAGFCYRAFQFTYHFWV